MDVELDSIATSCLGAASHDLAQVNSSVCLRLKKQALCQVSGTLQGKNISLVK